VGADSRAISALPRSLRSLRWRSARLPRTTEAFARTTSIAPPAIGARSSSGSQASLRPLQPLARGVRRRDSRSRRVESAGARRQRRESLPCSRGRDDAQHASPLIGQLRFACIYCFRIQPLCPGCCDGGKRPSLGQPVPFVAIRIRIFTQRNALVHIVRYVTPFRCRGNGWFQIEKVK
jgi:hypothetical protein